MKLKIAAFGEAERGSYLSPYFFNSVTQLYTALGNPPSESKGLFFAIQSLLNQYELIFFRVKEEGFSMEDYMRGLEVLEKNRQIQMLHALALPGVGDTQIIQATDKICKIYRSILIMNEYDFYDYITNGKKY